MRRGSAPRLDCAIHCHATADIASESAQTALTEIGNTPKPRKNAGGILPGTRFERNWKGKVCVVVATADGFEYNGQTYKSLSGAAFAITGTQWNGKKFFGVK